MTDTKLPPDCATDETIEICVEEFEKLEEDGFSFGSLMVPTFKLIVARIRFEQKLLAEEKAARLRACEVLHNDEALQKLLNDRGKQEYDDGFMRGKTMGRAEDQ